MKRILSFALAFVMVLSLVPAVSAAETELTGLTVNGLSVTCGETMTWSNETLVSPAPAGSSIAWQVSGRQIVAVATPGSFVGQAGATLTFKNELDHPATLSFAYSFAHTPSDDPDEDDLAEVLGLDGDSGEFNKELAGGESYTITVISPLAGYGFDPAVLTISNLSLAADGEATVTFQPGENGSYTVGDTEITADTDCTAATGTKYAVSATAASGYRFFGWHDGSEYVSYMAETELTISETTTIRPVFIKSDVAVFGVGESRFQSLTEADAYAKKGSVKTIVLMNDGILTGEHTISAGNTLLIPYDAANSVHTEATPTAIPNETGNLWTNVAWEKPSAYRTLTVAQGAKLTIQGSLNVGGRHSAGPWKTAGSPSGKLGMIRMAEGSNITVANGGVLYCWGYIYGDGTVTAKSGATIHENIQFADFRGGNATAGIALTFLVFPMSQYYVQNIEAATTYEYGAIENVWGSIFVGSNNQVYGTSVQFIGSDPKTAMFVPGNNGSVTKTYIPSKDRLQLDIAGGGSINPMTLTMEAITSVMGGPLNTETFVLPINSNMTINVKSGTTTLNQSLGLLPGSVLTIDEGATLYVNKGDVLTDSETGDPVLYTGGHNLIVYDREQWFQGWTEDMEQVDTYNVYNGSGLARLQSIPYTVTGTYTRTESDLVDAVLDINGQLITDGFIYTTVNIEYNEETEEEAMVGNTPIISSRKTGKVIMQNGAGQDYLTMQASQNGAEPVFVYLFMTSARLQNADGTYLDTMGAESGATYNYCADCGNWIVGEKATHRVDITWIVNGESVTQEFCKDTVPVYGNGTDPEKDGYKFIGWSTEADGEVLTALPNATEDATYWAIFEEETTGLLGDLNDDGKVDSDDLTKLARHVGGIELVSGQALKNADVNGDGKVDSDDLTKHARFVGGIIKDWSQE